ncbi:MAG: type ISP restriction/modification enzyme, partial [Spirochaetota bacterium]
RIMKHFLDINLGIVLQKNTKTEFFSEVFVSQHISDKHLIGHQTFLFPLYLYQRKDNPKKRSFGSIMVLFEPQADYMAKKPNLSPALVEQLTKEFKKTPSPEQIFFYIYAILYSNTYRTKYAEFLKIDFPRIPFTKDYKLFSKMAGYGEKLVDLHLLESTELDPPIAKFQGKGDNKVEKPRYDEKEQRVYFNQSQYFEGITKEVWQYQIGGYQVCDKWLKDRKEGKLSLDDSKNYCKIITSLQKTIKIQKAIDDIYPEVEKETVEF